jgi:hypothetical protein
MCITQTILNTFLELNKLNVSIRKRSNEKFSKTYEILTTNKKSCNIIITYFNNFPLFARK